MPEKLTRSTQRSVAWQTSSEYRRLTVPSGRILSYVSFVRKIQIPEIFGSPSYMMRVFYHRKFKQGRICPTCCHANRSV